MVVSCAITRGVLQGLFYLARGKREGNTNMKAGADRQLDIISPPGRIIMPPFWPYRLLLLTLCRFSKTQTHAKIVMRFARDERV